MLLVQTEVAVDNADVAGHALSNTVAKLGVGGGTAVLPRIDTRVNECMHAAYDTCRRNVKYMTRDRA